MAAVSSDTKASGVLAGLVSEKALAEELDRCTRTLENWRREGMPVAISRAGLRYYDVKQVRDWLMGKRPKLRRRRGRQPEGITQQV